MKFTKHRKIKKYKTKELKPKDGYNRFKFCGKVFRYNENAILETEHDFSGKSLPVGATYAYDEDGNRYVVEFVFRNKWVPFNISQPNTYY